jgi:hypothetical protein
LAGTNSTPVTDKHPDFDPVVTAKLPDPLVLEEATPVYPESYRGLLRQSCL